MAKEDKENEKNLISEEVLRWIKLNVILTHKTGILETLTSPKEQLLFQESNGKTSRELAAQFQMDKRTVMKFWKKWVMKGIAQPIPVKGGGIRAQRSFSLEDFGIEIPSFDEAKGEKRKEEE